MTAHAGGFPLDVAFVADAPVTALFGRSGSGKTSIMNALAGLLTPKSGRIVCDGTVLFDSALGIDVAPQARRIGYVFQESLLFPHLSVERNLRYGMNRHQRAAPLITFDQAVALLDLKPLLDRAPATLSGGEARRAAIGRALLSDPRLLLLDEPLAGLDVNRRNEILRVIERLRDTVRLPIVFVSHAVGEVTRLADTMVIVADGTVIATGTVEDVMNRIELRPHTGRYEAGAVVPCTVLGHDAAYDLTTLHFPGGELELPRIDAERGERVRVRIRARDVTLASDRPGATSTRNILGGKIAAMSEEAGPVIDVAIDVGEVRLIARITRRSRDELGLAVGRPCYAMVKSVSLDRRSAGYG
jgi:molybdate transport system ATP-binding protein